MPGKEAGRPVTVTLMRQLSDLPCGIVLGGKGSLPAPLGMGLAIRTGFLASQMRVRLWAWADAAVTWLRVKTADAHRNVDARLARGAGRGGGSFGLIGERWLPGEEFHWGFISRVRSLCGLVSEEAGLEIRCQTCHFNPR